jgi:hypothetical protein
MVSNIYIASTTHHRKKRELRYRGDGSNEDNLTDAVQDR